MGNGRNASMPLTALLSLFIAYGSSLADDAGTSSDAFDGGESLSCAIAFDGSDKYTAALFTSTDDEVWIGWIWLTGSALDPIQFKVEKNDVDGIKFIGSHGPFDVRVHVSAASKFVSVVRATVESNQSVYGEGYCATLNEAEYVLDVANANSG